MIFKLPSSANEIESSMQENEYKIASEQDLYNETLLVKALEELSKAANNFEKAGLSKFATDVTLVMASLTKNKNKKKKKKVTNTEKKVFKNYGFSSSDLQNNKDNK